MTQAEQFKLVATILKQHEPFSDDRCAAQAMIKFYQEQYEDDKLRAKLQEMINA